MHKQINILKPSILKQTPEIFMQHSLFRYKQEAILSYNKD